jgi:hypothetical protein
MAQNGNGICNLFWRALSPIHSHWERILYVLGLFFLGRGIHASRSRGFQRSIVTVSGPLKRVWILSFGLYLCVLDLAQEKVFKQGPYIFLNSCRNYLFNFLFYIRIQLLFLCALSLKCLNYIHWAIVEVVCVKSFSPSYGHLWKHSVIVILLLGLWDKGLPLCAGAKFGHPVSNPTLPFCLQLP